MQLIASEVSAHYYTHPPGIVKSSQCLHLHTGNGLTYRVGSTTKQRIACTGSWSQQPVLWMRWKWEIACLEWEFNSGHHCYRIQLHLMAPWCHHYTTIPVYAGPCLRGQCRLLHYHQFQQFISLNKPTSTTSEDKFPGAMGHHHVTVS